LEAGGRGRQACFIYSRSISMKALIIGATGATGKDLVDVLLKDPAYTEVVIFVRRPGKIDHPKLTEVLTDVLFSCLGTTLKMAGSKDKQWHIDYEIPLEFAAIAKANGVNKAVLLSAYGASVDSRVFYSRTKGKLEDDMASLIFRQYIIFRPGLLLRKDTDRSGERFMGGVLKFLNSIGLIRKFRPMPTSTLAEKMAKAPKALGAGRHVIELQKIFGF
jgi:uncharacterized protein YbjT (DUF2867 family)